MTTDDRESFIRWQGITRDYFSIVSNLVLGLSTGILAFFITSLVSVQSTTNCLLIIATVSMILLVVSVGLAVWCAINRLRDFRATAQIARSRYKEESIGSNARHETTVLGQLSWRLFWWQLILFGFGAAAIGITIIIQMWS